MGSSLAGSIHRETANQACGRNPSIDLYVDGAQFYPTCKRRGAECVESTGYVIFSADAECYFCFEL